MGSGSGEGEREIFFGEHVGDGVVDKYGFEGAA